MDINWFDGKDAVGQYILEINFVTGSKGYIKNHSLDNISYYYSILKDHEDCVSFVVHHPKGHIETSYSKVA